MPCSRCSQNGHNVRTCLQPINQELQLPQVNYVPIDVHHCEEIESDSDEDIEEIEEINSGCPICYENINDINYCVTSCKHKFCLKCFIKHIQIKDNCPMCRHELNFGLIPPNIRDHVTILNNPIQIRYKMTVINTTNQIIDINWLHPAGTGALPQIDVYSRIATVKPCNERDQPVGRNYHVFLFTPRNIIERYHRDIIVPNRVRTISFEDFIRNFGNTCLWAPQDILEQRYIDRYKKIFSGNGLYIIHDNGVEFQNY